MNWGLGIAVGALALGPMLIVSPAVQEGEATAPDGRPGLGSERSAYEVGRLFASPDEEEEEFLRRLHDLPSDILIQREFVRRGYRTQGYFDLLDRTDEQELSVLHAKYKELESKSLEALMTTERVANTFMRLYLDLRFQMRRWLLESYEFEASELRRGLRILHAAQEGLFDLRNSEVQNITSRIDLAAANLRAIHLDLDALRERGDNSAPGAPDPAWMAELIGITKLSGEKERAAALRSLEEKVNQRLGRLASSLFSKRLAAKTGTLVDKRTSFAEQALEHLERTKRFLLIPPFDEDPPRQIKDMSINERHRYALSEAIRGVTADPLNEELAYYTGIATDMIYTPQEGRMWFDRYLALRGIRGHDHRTTKDRELTDQETYALEKVQQAYSGLGGLLGR